MMTHKELLDIISVRSKNFETFNLYPPGFAEALRAVVELHKPKDVSHMPTGWFICEECSKYLDKTFIAYPCPTIQAIEAELK
jgi:hypothetical protein